MTRIEGDLEARILVNKHWPQQPLPKDRCEVCHGTRGGVPGNENIIDGKVMCDYCTSDAIDNRKKP